MRFTKLLCPTLKETPKDAEVVSHQLMLRAGLIRKVASGIYSYLPLGLRVIRKFENIVREEMDRANGLEVLLPMVCPADLWQESGRWDQYGKELLRLKDRHENEFCLGPTHEEVITDMVRKNVRSYKELPLLLYQIQTKFRDEIRPRFGLMRGREFGMKDAYSFHTDETDLLKTYQQMAETYSRIFQRCGLKFKIVKADSGSIGGDASQEFMVTANTGEDAIIECNNCNYAANLEAAETMTATEAPMPNPAPAPEEIHTPNLRTVEEVALALKAKPTDFIKTLIYQADEKPVAVLIRGDYAVNEIKLKNALNCKNLALADEKTIMHVTLAPVGFAGPQSLKNIKIIADHSIKTIGLAVTGANKKDHHIKNIILIRDYQPDLFADIRFATEKDICPKCQKGQFQIIRGIEVGHIFQLKDKYSRALKADYLDITGKTQTMTMGCYGIGIGRTVAAAIEQNHDEKGMLWPLALAPYHVDIILTSKQDPDLVKAAETIYQELCEAGIEVIFDDRNESAGIKFKDAELIGFPIQLVIGKQFSTNQKLELKLRKTNESMLIEKGQLVETIHKIIRQGAA